MAKKAKAKKRSPQSIDAALAAVREGRTPDLKGNQRFGTRIVVDPYDGADRPKVVRFDPLDSMRAHGHLRRDDDRDALSAKVRFEAGREWQRRYQAAEIGSAKAIDFTRDVVDGGKTESDTDHRLQAQQSFMDLNNALYDAHRPIVRRILGEERTLQETARMMGITTKRGMLKLSVRFLDALDALADKIGLKHAPNQRRGPRRQRDRWDEWAPYAHQPLLVAAIRAARR